ncbi:MAG: hypothetical protein HLUCCA12_12885 [Rhodobacteraceae bacterium HLUCCA12]|nr:MAG: hypothetical protein HLUCCA12_12885 [Rhodobacteraceae bacterium HLUCCA12]
MIIFLAIATIAAGAIAIALATAPRDGFETQIFIAAPPREVWKHLSDPRAIPLWNPSMRHVEGRFAKGARLRLTMESPSGGTITFRPRVLVAESGQELRWLGRLGLPRLFDGEHYFRLIPEAGGTRLIHGERFQGVLLWAMSVAQFRPIFEAANQGLKRRVEAAAIDASRPSCQKHGASAEDHHAKPASRP